LDENGDSIQLLVRAPCRLSLHVIHFECGKKMLYRIQQDSRKGNCKQPERRKEAR